MEVFMNALFDDFPEFSKLIRPRKGKSLEIKEINRQEFERLAKQHGRIKSIAWFFPWLSEECLSDIQNAEWQLVKDVLNRYNIDHAGEKNSDRLIAEAKARLMLVA
jgi:hypothetical protein